MDDITQSEECSAKPTTKTGQVGKMLDELEKSISYQGELLTQLCQKTESICSEYNESPRETSEDSCECRLARILRIKKENIDINNEIINDLIRRIEL